MISQKIIWIEKRRLTFCLINIW